MTKMTRHIVEVSDSALMHLCLMGLESYSIPKKPLETYGLLFGTSSYNEYKEFNEIYYRVDHALTDIEADRRKKVVYYNEENFKLKKNIIQDCWPALSFLGDFHTHPFESLSDEKKQFGFSDGDRKDIEEKNRKFWIETELKISLVLSIYRLQRDRSTKPERVDKKNHIIEWTLRNYDRENDNRKECYRLQLAAYVINKVEDDKQHRLILVPRENDWKNVLKERLEEKLKEHGESMPEHEVWLDIPSVLGTYNFWGR